MTHVICSIHLCGPQQLVQVWVCRSKPLSQNSSLRLLEKWSSDECTFIPLLFVEFQGLELSVACVSLTLWWSILASETYTLNRICATGIRLIWCLRLRHLPSLGLNEPHYSLILLKVENWKQWHSHLSWERPRFLHMVRWAQQYWSIPTKGWGEVVWNERSSSTLRCWTEKPLKL